MGFFNTHTVTVRQSNPTNGQILGQHLPVQMDPVNLDWQMQVDIPVDVFDCETIGWTQPVPARSDYLIDETTGAQYSMFSTVFVGQNCLQFRVSKPSGRTP